MKVNIFEVFLFRILFRLYIKRAIAILSIDSVNDTQIRHPPFSLDRDKWLSSIRLIPGVVYNPRMHRLNNYLAKLRGVRGVNAVGAVMRDNSSSIGWLAAAAVLRLRRYRNCRPLWQMESRQFSRLISSHRREYRVRESIAAIVGSAIFSTHTHTPPPIQHFLPSKIGFVSSYCNFNRQFAG